MEARINDNMFLCADLRPSEYVIAHSPTFGECGAYVQNLFVPHGADADYPPMATVRMELDDDHPAMRDALGDNPELTADSAEFIDILPVDWLERPDGRPIRVWTRLISAAERAERARRRGFTRLALPELDQGLSR